MIKNYIILFVIAFAIIVNKGYSQVSYGGTPPSFTDKSTNSRFELREFSKPDMNKIMAEDSAKEMDKGMYRVGVSVPINLNMENSGTWTSLSDGRNIWRLTIKCAEARAIAVYYDNFYLPKGAELFLYNKRKNQVIGAFTYLSNPESGYFSTELIQGDEVTFEYVSSPISLVKPVINISEISYAYRGVDNFFPSIDKATGWGQSGSCEVNVNCSEGNNWQNQKRSSAVMFIISNSGQAVCSGALVNNTSNNCTPYFLSAYHCWDYATTAQMHQWQFYFNFESTGCTTPANQPSYNTITGCTFKSYGNNSSGSDFLLVGLDQTIPANYNTYFSGWSRSTTGSPSGVGIHHPMGDIKKISTYTSTLLSATYTQIANAHWSVHWIGTTNGHGVTEGGSSGSPIYDNAGLVVGTLSGGASYCSNLNGLDYYGKFSYHWLSNGTTNNKRLSPWLDPTNSNVNTLTGINTCNACVNPAAPTSPSASPSSITCGGSSDLSAISSGNIIKWYTVSTGGVVLGSKASGVAFNVAPTITTTYYAEAYSSCASLTRASITITVTQTAPVPQLVIASPDTVCLGDSSTLSATSSVGIIQWWTASTGGSLIGSTISGGQLVVSPTVTSSYYAKTITPCGTSLFDSVTIAVITTSSVAANSVIIFPSVICVNDSATLAATGGTLASDANWYWYTGSCGGTLIGTNAAISLIPAAIDYYVRAEGICNITTCISANVIISVSSVTADSLSASQSVICSGTTTTINALGGITGTGANWYWYSGSCGGTFEGTGTVITVAPTIITDFYIRAEGICNTTTCVSKTIALNVMSNPPVSLSALQSTICSSAATTLNVTGGSLGTNADYYWYVGSCGGVSTDTATATIIASPTVTSSYFVRIEGLCNTTVCISTEVIVNTQSTDATSATASSLAICNGISTTLGLSGGSLGVGANWNWYINSCGGTTIGSVGITLVVTPTTNTTYFVRAENLCNSTNCVSIEVIVNTQSTDATSATASSLTICNGISTTLVPTGGNLGVGANWNWYTGSCGSTYVKSGTAPVVTPASTTTYFVRAENFCNTTNCVSITIDVLQLPSMPSALTGNNVPVSGNTETYSITNVANVYYTWTAPSGWVGTSNTNSIEFTVGATSGILSVIPNNTCGAGVGISIIIGTGGNQISGNFTYDNIAQTPLDSIMVYLMYNGSKVDSIQATALGYYQFNNIPDGAYNVTVKTNKAWGGVNITDAILAKKHYAGSQLLTSSIRIHAGDVNSTLLINTTDALKIARRYSGADTAFARSNWVFEKALGGDTINVSTYMNDTVIVSGANVVQNFKGICVGDVNGSYNSIPTGNKSLFRKVRSQKFEVKSEKL